MIYRPRTYWQTEAEPVTGPAINWPGIVRIVIHYPGGTVKKPYDSIQRVRGEQHFYLTQRGYSLGYNWLIDEQGEVFEARGFDIKCAANSEVNATSVAIQIIVNNAEPANAAQIKAVQELITEIRSRNKPGLPIVTHASVATNSSHTPCPGAGITAQLNAGQFEPVPTPPPYVPPVFIPGKLKRAMLIDYAKGTPSYTRFVTNFTHIAWIFDGQWSGIVGDPSIGLPIVEMGWEDLLSAIRSLKPTTPPPPAVQAAPNLLEAWNAPRPN